MFLLAGDETAIPAMSQLLESLPPEKPVRAFVETADPAGRFPLPEHPEADVEWCELPAGAAAGEAMVDAVRGAAIDAGTQIWVAGEAAAVQRIRSYLFNELGVPRARAWVRGYWKQGRSGDDEEDA